MINYPINQIFQTIQGEGIYAGVPSIFIRLQGCSVKCSWCDTKYTWKKFLNKEISIKNILKKTTLENTWANINYAVLIDIIRNKNWKSKHIVITGGEPALFNLKPLIYNFEKEGFKCQIETSGIKFINCSKNTWITISPKLNISNSNYNILNKTLMRANEIKFPIFNEKDINAIDIFLKNKKYNKNCIISLQPISCNDAAIKICIKNCILRNWRLSTQIHKYINIL